MRNTSRLVLAVTSLRSMCASIGQEDGSLGNRLVMFIRWMPKAGTCLPFQRVENGLPLCLRFFSGDGELALTLPRESCR
jgi:hypothetical protein